MQAITFSLPLLGGGLGRGSPLPAFGHPLPRRERVVLRSRGNRNSRNRRNRGKCLAAETEGVERFQVFKSFEFGGGVPFEGRKRILLRHAFTIIGNANALAPSRPKIHRHRGSPSV